jgi:septum formation protein
MNGHPLVLASGSPRRRELLAAAGFAFDVVPARIDECAHPGEGPRELALRLALEKARAVAQRLPAAPPRWVLGADTVVVLGEHVLGKPDDADDALAMLSRLAGHSHVVITGVAVVASHGGAARSAAVATQVHMRRADAAELSAYVASGEPLDKAGAYAIQGAGRRLVSGFEGSESNVIGLPMDTARQLLIEAGCPVPPA